MRPCIGPTRFAVKDLRGTWTNLRRRKLIGLNSTEKAELTAILQELELSPFERRKKRMIEAEKRLWGAAERGQSRFTGLADLLRDVRLKTRTFTLDEFLLVNFGLLPSEVAKLREERAHSMT
jgi:hypothetical protein